MPPNQPITVEVLTQHLFGNPLDPEDRGIIGDMRKEMQKTNERLDRLLKLGWAVLLTFVGCLATVIIDLLTRIRVI